MLQTVAVSMLDSACVACVYTYIYSLCTASACRLSPADVDEVLHSGMQWTQKHGYSWPEDSDSCEESGCYPDADPSQVSTHPSIAAVQQSQVSQCWHM